MTDAGLTSLAELSISTTDSGPNARDAFRYTPLDANLREIRLIRAVEQPPEDGRVVMVNPTSYSGLPVSKPREPAPDIEIHTFTLDQVPPYTALSYVWGSDIRDHNVTCCSKKLSVTENLKTVLRRLALFPGWYWIDGICINQNDIDEKSSQVQLMYDIYSSAIKVVAFLGDPPGDIGVEALLALLALNRMLDNKTKVTDTVKAAFRKHRSRYLRLLLQPWFSRGWVVQEAAANRTCSFWYGNTDIPIDLLLSVVQQIQLVSGLAAQMGGFLHKDLADDMTQGFDPDPDRIQSNVSRHFRQTDSIGRLRSLLENGTAVSLIRALDLGRVSMVADERDRVYAYLGFASEDVQKRLVPDYSATNSVYDVYMQTACAGIESGEVVNVLLGAGYSSEHLPSWVPNWSTWYNSTFPFSEYKCASTSQPITAIDVKNPRALSVRGAVIDKVSQVLQPRGFIFGTTPPLPRAELMDNVQLPLNFDDSQRSWYLTLLQDAAFCRLATQYFDQPYPTGEHPKDVVWRTMTGDMGLATRGIIRPPPLLDQLGAITFSHLFRDAQSVPEAFIDGNPGVQRDALHDLAISHHLQVTIIQEGRRGGMTSNRYMAVLPDVAEVDDLIVIALGIPMPLVIRKVEDKNGQCFRFLGPAYVHGIMDGELMEQHSDDPEQWSVRGVDLKELRVV